MTEKPVVLGTDFDSRNWLQLLRLSKMGYAPDEAREMMARVEDGSLEWNDIGPKARYDG